MRRHILSIQILALFGLLLAAPARAQEGSVGPPLAVGEYVEQVLDRNPGLSSMVSAIEAAEERVPQAGALPDPMVGFSLMSLPLDTFVFDQEPMTQKQLTLSQAFPAPGVRGARSTVAEAGVETSRLMLDRTREELRKQARLTWLDLYFLDERIRVVQENQALLDQFVQVAETRYRTGSGIQQDVLKAELERSRLTERLIGLEEQRSGLVSRLNALRDMPLSTPVRAAPITAEGGQMLAPADSLAVRAMEHSPALLVARAERERRQAAIDLAERMRLPNWSASASYGQRDGGRPDFLTAMVSVQVPLWAGSKQDRAVREEEARLTQRDYRIRDMELQIQGEVERLVAELRRTRRLTDLYTEQILPQSEGVLSSTLSGYRVDQVDFLTLLSAQTTLFNYQLEAVRVEVDARRRTAELEALVGDPARRDAPQQE
ncbi:MAG: TolC family protein [bacterium]